VSEPPPQDRAFSGRDSARQIGRTGRPGSDAFTSPQQLLPSDAPYRVALRWWRQRRRLSLGELGALVYCTRQHLSAIELGERRGSLDTAERLDGALNAAGDLLRRYRCEEPLSVSVRSRTTVDAPDSADGECASVLSGSDDRDEGQARAVVESMELSRQTEASELGPVTLEHLDLAVQRYGLIYLQVPARELFREIVKQRRYVVELLQRRHTLAERSRLYAVSGWLTGLLAHLAMDLGDVQAARAHSMTALQLASEIGHGDLAAWVWGTRAMTEIYCGDAREAISCTEAGERSAPPGSSAAVRLPAQAARACGRLRDEISLQRALDAAEAAYSQLSEAPTHSILSFDAPYLPFYAGTAYAWLGGQPRRVEEYAERTLALCDAAPAAWPVTRALARLDLATARIAQGAPDAAARLGWEILDIYENERQVALILRRAGELREALSTHTSAPDVRLFLERLRSTAERTIPWIAPPETRLKLKL
jgi:transcriptional regulator with XRE-family HTH domain